MSDFKITRRSLARGGAWAVPAIALSAAAPAMALSCPSTVQDEVNSLFSTYLSGLKAAVGDLTGEELRLWFIDVLHSNGAQTNPAIRAFNAGSKPLDFRLHRLLFELGVRNVDTSPAVNTSIASGTIVKNSSGIDTKTVTIPYDPSGLPNQAGLVRDPATGVGECSKRNLAFSTSFGDFYSNDGMYKDLGRTGIGNSKSVCEGADRTWLFAASLQNGAIVPANKGLKADNHVEMVAFQLQDGKTGTKRYYQALGVKPLGFAPPTWDMLVEQVKAAHPELSEEDIASCYTEAYRQRAQVWMSSEERNLGLKISVYGWSTADNASDEPRKADSNGWYWSHVIGNYQTAMGTSGSPVTTGSVTRQPWLHYNANGVSCKGDPQKYFTSVLYGYDQLRIHDGIF